MNPRLIAARHEFDDQVMRRLQRLADQWQPSRPEPPDPEPGLPVDSGSSGEPEPGPAAVAAGGATGFLTRLDRRSLRAVLALVCAAGLVAGWMWWQGRPRAVALAPTLTSAGTPVAGTDAAGGLGVDGGDVVVHVLGAVRKPGLLRLPAGSRVDDAIQAAGGTKTPKALASVNLARSLVDGEQILVTADGAPPGGQGSGSSAGVGLNSASASEFEALPGVGPVLAQRIVDWRTTNGSFRSIDELGEVSGIGDSILEQLRPLVHV
jgi:competence protein ComEA